MESKEQNIALLIDDALLETSRSELLGRRTIKEDLSSHCLNLHSLNSVLGRQQSDHQRTAVTCRRWCLLLASLKAIKSTGPAYVFFKQNSSSSSQHNSCSKPNNLPSYLLLLLLSPHAVLKSRTQTPFVLSQQLHFRFWWLLSPVISHGISVLLGTIDSSMLAPHIFFIKPNKLKRSS